MGKRSGFENKIMMTAEVRITEGDQISNEYEKAREESENRSPFSVEQSSFSILFPARNAKLGSSSKQVEATSRRS
jgi:hypothetical protein